MKNIKNNFISNGVKEENNKFNIPTILVVFGATGDLISKKIIPALFHLFEKEELPRFFKVIGFARRNIADAEFHKLVKEALAEHGLTESAPEKINSFLKLFSYRQGTFEAISDYKNLDSVIKAVDADWGLCANKLFYLAAPPEFYAPIFKNLASSGLTKPCSEEEGWTRVIVEKPFGKDFKTANALEALLSKLFKEIQIYRIDHYLAKEMLQGILTFRFSNNLFEQSWNNNFIEKVEIRLWETLGVEKRGGFYDGVGALRDVGQNHLLQILALIAMDHPESFSADAIRSKREGLLKTLTAPQETEIKNFSFRAQYDGYRDIAGVNRNSAIETYFKMRASLSLPKWLGVPFILESGKRLKEQRKEIVITFKHPTPCLCPSNMQEHYKNKIIIRLEPKEQITIQFWTKKPGLAFAIEERDLTFLLREQDKRTQYTEEYEKLLLDCIVGNQTLFVSSGEVKAMWSFIDPIINAWQKNIVPLEVYKSDTDEPIIKSKYIEQSTIPASWLKREIGIVGLGKMGGNLAKRLIEKGWVVYGYNKTPKETEDLKKEGLRGVYSLKELAAKLSPPRLVWLMVPADKSVDEVLFGKDALVTHMEKGDFVIDGGNSFYKDSITRFEKLNKKRINFMDVGVSGGPDGARHGASLMVGGERKIFQKLEPLFYDLAKEMGYKFFEGSGAGHFVKMIHNGIEYGMMQSIAEGFTILKKAKYSLNLIDIAEVYNHGSVIESRLIGWLKNALEIYGSDLQKVSGSVGRTGEGEWTVKTAKELKVAAKVIEDALKFRTQSERNPSYAGKILSALRNQFGGHDIASENKKTK